MPRGVWRNLPRKVATLEAPEVMDETPQHHQLWMEDEKQLEVAANISVPPPEVTTGAKEEVEAYKAEGGNVRLLKGPPVFCKNTEVTDNMETFKRLSGHTERFTYKRWVIAVIGVASDEQGMRDIAATNNLLGLPFFLGTVGAETLMVYKCSDKDKHKPKELLCDATVERRCLSKTGNQVQKAVELVQSVMDTCTESLTNMAIETPTNKAPVAGEVVVTMDYRETLDTVIAWGLDRFEAFFGDAKIKTRKKEALSDLEANVMTCFGTLQPVVKLREDAQAMVFDLNSEKFARQCPLPLHEGASEYAMTGAKVVVWETATKEFVSINLAKWLDGYCETHSLIIVGRAGAGKSKLMHMLAWELCVGKEGGCTEYVFTKALDPLGVLSHSGMLRRAGCLVLTDFTLKTGRNIKIDDEELKSLLDVVEGGTIQSTRYRAAIIDPGLPRVIAVNTGGDISGNGTNEDYGAWHRGALEQPR